MSHAYVLEALQTFRKRYRLPENTSILFGINWAGVLDTDTIATTTWTAENSGTVANEANNDPVTNARLTGSAGRTYRFTNKITTTTTGDTHERQIDLSILDNDQSLNNDYGFEGYG